MIGQKRDLNLLNQNVFSKKNEFYTIFIVKKGDELHN